MSYGSINTQTFETLSACATILYIHAKWIRVEKKKHPLLQKEFKQLHRPLWLALRG